MRKIFGKVLNERRRKQDRRKLTIRSKIVGTAERPRICAIKTNKCLQVQVIDDAANKTLFSVQTFGKNKVAEGNNKAAAEKVGAAVASKLKERNVTTAVFDRNGNIYAAVMATVADSIRAGGIQV